MKQRWKPRPVKPRSRRTLVLISFATVALLALVATSSASAAATWGVKARWGPQHLVPGQPAELYIQGRNLGDSSPDESPITIEDQLPPGVTITSFPNQQPPFGWECSGVGTGVATCTMSGIFGLLLNGPRGSNVQQVGYSPRIFVDVTVDPDVSGTFANRVTMSGGSFPNPAVDEDPITIGGPPAGFGFVKDSFMANVYDDQFPAGEAESQSSSHPFELRVDFDFNLQLGEERRGRYTFPEELVRTIETTLPKGMIGNPEATPKCQAVDFLGNVGGISSVTQCPSDTQVGILQLELGNGTNNNGFGPIGPGTYSRIPIYNLIPPKGQAADFGFNIAGLVTGHILPTPDPAQGYAIKAVSPDTSSFLQVRDVSFTMWGVPADPAHDNLRGDPVTGEFGASSDGTIKPLLTLPSNCGTADAFKQRANSWQHPERWTPTAQGPDPLSVTGCDDPRIRFEPEVKLRPTSQEAGGPTGLQVDLQVPQQEGSVSRASQLYASTGDIRAMATPPLKKAVVTMPEGMTLSTAAAQGLGSCSPQQISLGTDNPVTCPDNSQYGTLTLHTPILPKDAPMTGQIYVAKQNDNPFNNFLSLYLVIQDSERGLLVKIPGRVDLDPVTGQITATFDDLPQFPVSDMELNLKSGVRAALVNPSTCGAKTIEAKFYSWADPNTPITKTSSYDVSGSCVNSLNDRPFHPTMQAGTLNPSAGAYSPFVYRTTRSDDDQEFSQLNVGLPKGLLANISGIAKCSDAAIAAAEAPGRTGTEEKDNPSCPGASEIGSTDVGSGVGQVLTYVPGKAYLAGPYKGAPLSMVVITPILAGPYDLGVIAVRSKVDVDRVTTQATVNSDPLPQIFKGIPVRIRDVQVKVDRAKTTLNPTNCTPTEVASHLSSTGGAGADLSSRFQAANCASLPFKPKLRFKLKGGTHRGDYPALTATLKARPGDANIARTAVTLPHSEFLAQEHIRTVCTRVQFAANACPAASIYGHASATSPLFDETLEGPVYLRSSSNPLPDLVAKLDGEIDVELSGRIDSVNQGIRNTFDVVPDAPVDTFTLSMQGGKKGLLVNSRNLCKGTNRANVVMLGQNGKRLNAKPLVANSCKQKKRKHKKAKAHKRAAKR